VKFYVKFDNDDFSTNLTRVTPIFVLQTI